MFCPKIRVSKFGKCFIAKGGKKKNASVVTFLFPDCLLPSFFYEATKPLGNVAKAPCPELRRSRKHAKRVRKVAPRADSREKPVFLIET